MSSLPQLAWIVIMLLGVGVSINDHGKPKTGNENALYAFFGALLQFVLLWWGGFFR